MGGGLFGMIFQLGSHLAGDTESDPIRVGSGRVFIKFEIREAANLFG